MQLVQFLERLTNIYICIVEGICFVQGKNRPKLYFQSFRHLKKKTICSLVFRGDFWTISLYWDWQIHLEYITYSRLVYTVLYIYNIFNVCIKNNMWVTNGLFITRSDVLRYGGKSWKARILISEGEAWIKITYICKTIRGRNLKT